MICTLLLCKDCGYTSIRTTEAYKEGATYCGMCNGRNTEWRATLADRLMAEKLAFPE